MLDILLPPPRRSRRPRAGRSDKTLEVVRTGDDETRPHPGKTAQTASGRQTGRAVRGSGSVRSHRVPMVEIFSSQGMEEMDINFKDMFGSLFPKKTKRRKVKVPEALKILEQEEAQRLIDMDKVVEHGHRAGGTERHHFSGRDRQDRRPRPAAGTGRVPRRRAAGPAAHRGRVDRDHQVRHGENGPHPVHRRGRFPYVQAVGLDPRTAGPLSHPGGTRTP